MPSSTSASCHIVLERVDSEWPALDVQVSTPVLCDMLALVTGGAGHVGTIWSMRWRRTATMCA